MGIRKLYGSLDCCIGTMRALASLFEHELEFEFITVDLKNLNESFLELSPFGELPVYQDDDLILFESRAVMRTISHEYVKPGIKQIFMEPLLQGVVASWIDVGTHHFEPPAKELLSEFILKPKLGQSTDMARVSEAEERLASVLDVYEKRLSNSPYLGGEIFTSAEVTIMPYLHKLKYTAVNTLFEERPNVKAWCDKILFRPAWVKVVHMVENN